MITIITHRRPDGPAPWIAQCAMSVGQAMVGMRVDEVQYEVVRMRGGYAQARWDALQLSEFVGFVDDDDTISPDAIRLCKAALDATGAGVAYTVQRLMSKDGGLGACTRPARGPLDVAMSPQPLHHFALIRRDALDTSALDAAHKIGIGADWLFKACAALKHGAVHVPIEGYQWRQYPGQDSEIRAGQFRDALPDLRAVTCGWMRDARPFPRYAPAKAA